MKRFCTQCGKELKKGVLICPSCGNTNKKVKKNRKGLVKILALFLFVAILGIFGYFFRNNIGMYMSTTVQQYNQYIDKDFDAKQEYKKHYQKYVLELDYFYRSSGYYQIREDRKGWTEIISERNLILNELENSNCFIKINTDGYCDSLWNKGLDVQTRIEKKIDTDYFFSEPRKCESCIYEIQEMYRLASGMRNTEVSNGLITLTSNIEKYYKSSLVVVDIRKEKPYQVKGFYDFSGLIEWSNALTDANKELEAMKNEINNQIAVTNGLLELNLSKVL
jgi:hypothetical protein